MITLQAALGIILGVVALTIALIIAPFIIVVIALTVIFIAHSIYDMFIWFRRKVRYLFF